MKQLQTSSKLLPTSIKNINIQKKSAANAENYLNLIEAVLHSFKTSLVKDGALKLSLNTEFHAPYHNAQNQLNEALPILEKVMSIFS